MNQQFEQILAANQLSCRVLLTYHPRHIRSSMVLEALNMSHVYRQYCSIPGKCVSPFRQK